MTARCSSAGIVQLAFQGIVGKLPGDRMHPSQVLPQAPVERVPDLSLGRLRAILGLGEQLWFGPDALMCDPLRVRLRLPDQRHQFLLEVSGGRLVKSVVELARIDQIVAVAAIDIDAVPFSLVESAIVSVSRWMQVFFTQSPVRPFG